MMRSVVDAWRAHPLGVGWLLLAVISAVHLLTIPDPVKRAWHTPFPGCSGTSLSPVDRGAVLVDTAVLGAYVLGRGPSMVWERLRVAALTMVCVCCVLGGLGVPRPNELSDVGRVRLDDLRWMVRGAMVVTFGADLAGVAGV